MKAIEQSYHDIRHIAKKEEKKREHKMKRKNEGKKWRKAVRKYINDNMFIPCTHTNAKN